VIIEVGGVGMTVASWLTVFKGMKWHPAKAKVVSKAAVSDRLGVIVLLHEQTPAPHIVALKMVCLEGYIGTKTPILSRWGQFFQIFFMSIFK
jgi:hypothetical protein